MTYRELATINTVNSQFGPDSINNLFAENVANKQFDAKLSRFDRYCIDKICKQLKEFAYEQKLKFALFPERMVHRQPFSLPFLTKNKHFWFALEKFYNSGWKITIDNYEFSPNYFEENKQYERYGSKEVKKFSYLFACSCHNKEWDLRFSEKEKSNESA